MQSHKTNVIENAKFGIANGIHLCRLAVEGTLGGRGTNVIIKQEFYPYYLQTKDAFSIIQAIKCEDPLESLAVDMMKDATDSMNKRSKDGRTTMCILADEILQGIQNSPDKDTDWEKELTNLVPFIEQQIDVQTKLITLDEVEAVARTASDSERLGKLIASIYKKMGKEVIINHIESSGTFDDEVEFTEGVHFTNTGFIAPAFVHDELAVKEGRREMKTIYEKPTILVTKNKISNENDIAPLIEKLLALGRKDLIIFTDDMDSDVIRKLINTHKAKLMNICVIKAPVVFKNYVFEDFAKATGATIVEDATGLTFKNLTLEHLGTCARIEIDKEEVILNPTVDLSEHIADLKKEGSDDSLRRVFWLTSKTAKIKLGAVNEGELSLMRLKCLDAIHSSQLALQYGIVAGGGISMFHVSSYLPKDNSGKLFKEILKAPFRQINKNAGIDINSIVLHSGDRLSISPNRGIDVKTSKVVDMFEAGIVDSALVQKNAVKNAIAIACRALTTNTFIDLPKRTTEDLQMEILGRQRQPFM